MKTSHFLFYFLSLIVLTSCYSDEVNIKTDADHSATYSPDSTLIYFVAHTRAWQSAKGLYAMPDGGKPKELYKNVSLYSYEIQTGKIIRLFDMGQLPYSLIRWNFRIVPGEPGVSFSLEPLGGWEQEIKFDSAFINVKRKLDNIFRISNDGEVESASSHFPEENIRKADLTTVHRYIRDLPLASFGLILKEIYPAREKQYINDLVSLSNTSIYRRAIIEQVITGKDPYTIREIINKMQGSIGQLTGVNKQLATMNEEENLKLLRKMAGD